MTAIHINYGECQNCGLVRSRTSRSPLCFPCHKENHLAVTQRQFWSNVRVDAECWTWMGSLDPHGYAWGHRPAYRQTYELLVGPVPAGLDLDHLCRNRACVNPAHLEPVTHAENNRRAKPYLNRTHCRRRLHPLPPREPGKRRICIECRHEWERAPGRRAAA